MISQSLADPTTSYKQYEVSRNLISQDLLEIKNKLKEEFRKTLKIWSWKNFYKLLGL